MQTFNAQLYQQIQNTMTDQINMQIKKYQTFLTKSPQTPFAKPTLAQYLASNLDFEVLAQLANFNFYILDSNDEDKTCNITHKHYPAIIATIAKGKGGQDFNTFIQNHIISDRDYDFNDDHVTSTILHDFENYLSFKTS